MSIGFIKILEEKEILLKLWAKVNRFPKIYVNDAGGVGLQQKRAGLHCIVQEFMNHLLWQRQGVGDDAAEHGGQTGRRARLFPRLSLDLWHSMVATSTKSARMKTNNFIVIV